MRGKENVVGVPLCTCKGFQGFLRTLPAPGSPSKPEDKLILHLVQCTIAHAEEQGGRALGWTYNSTCGIRRAIR